MSNELKDFFNKRTPQNLEKLKKHLSERNFVLFFLAKKQAGKGTYSKILRDITNNKIVHISVGDLIRDAEKELISDNKDQFITKLKTFYKGKDTEEVIVEELLGQSEGTRLLSTEVVIALLEMTIKENQDKSIIIDGFPRSQEQVALALKMQRDFEKKGIPSAFVEINCAEEILERRNIDRRICPVCQTPRNIKLLLTKEIEYDEKTGEFHLICENSECNRARYIQKQGDAKGLEQLKERQKEVQSMIDHVKKCAPGLHIVVHNAIPLTEASQHNKADFTEEAELSWDTQKKEVIRKFKPMIINNDEGHKAYSRWPEPVVVDLVDRLADWLDKYIENK